MSRIKSFSTAYTLANIHTHSDACESVMHRAVVVLSIDKLRCQRLSLNAACDTFLVASSTYYRWRKTLFERGIYALRDHRKCNPRNRLAPAQVRIRELVQQLRMEAQNEGKVPIWEKLKKHNIHVSISTVGRVFSKLLHRGAIPPITSAQKAVRSKQRNNKCAHAQRLCKRIIPATPGEVVQVDTSEITIEEANKDLQGFTRYYNFDRPHRALNLKSPMRNYNER